MLESKLLPIYSIDFIVPGREVTNARFADTQIISFQINHTIDITHTHTN